jgi:hypothetical protein
MDQIAVGTLGLVGVFDNSLPHVARFVFPRFRPGQLTR